MNFHKVLKKYRTVAFSKRDQGDRFERLMQAFLRTAPLYEGRFEHVWLWREFPYREGFGGKDVGIDLVARTIEGDYWAVQCKCWDERSTIDKSAVDGFLATSSKAFADDQGNKTEFAQRLWISTTNKWGSEAENSIHNQVPPVSRINLIELEEAPVDWIALNEGISGEKARTSKKKLREHQKAALEACHQHFKEYDRGKLIMACGTGKTFTSLKIAEKETPKGGMVLFLVPSIALLGQTLREWMAETERPIFPICICSDSEVSKKKIEDGGGYRVEDLALPASTRVPDIVRQYNSAKKAMKNTDADHPVDMVVVFSTYQSIDVIAKALKEIEGQFDLIICDEAHRTTGVTLKDDEETAFVKVHHNEFIRGAKRIYMTATPRLYNDTSKQKAKDADAILCSMDDEALYGPEIYRIGFGEAVDKKLLADYKVLVLTMKESQIPEALQKAIANRNQEITTDDASKLIGCINALSKRMLVDEGLLRASDPNPMHKAVAFCQNIKISKKITNVFNEHKDDYYNSLPQQERDELVGVFSDHVDGTMGATLRDEKLSWLKNTPTDGNDCRILTNVRCLSEGVDVPSLDAVMFLSARNSQVDVVQSVGRVMRIAPGKKYGYIIIPVVIPSNVSAEEALNDNERFKVVWTVLNALRAHDDRFNAMVNKIELNKRKPANGGSVLIGGIGGGSGDSDGSSSVGGKGGKEKQLTLPLQEIQQLQNVIYARMVQKVGNKRYWEQWAADVAKIAQGYIDRITNLIAKDGPHKKEFDVFLEGLRKNINPSVTIQEVIEMLAQHLITKPVFEALFENYSFVNNNPVSIALQGMVDLLEEQALEKDAVVLTRFYESVKKNVSGIDNAEGRQKVIVELYDKFFKTAFPRTVERLGIVYTPIEIVDYINNSVAAVLQKEFERSISDENVHILDPFTGTGTFIVRLLQTGLIKPKDLSRKYDRELHANEIVLLAYYIASINIENAFHDAMGEDTSYKAFNGICLTDTFQLGETDDANKLFASKLPQNSKRVAAQKKAPIRIIIGNPPYSAGQKSENDNAKNQVYPELESRIAETYVKESKATLSKGAYNSYIKAFRWATDRLDKNYGGIIAFVTSAGWLDDKSLDGFRQCIGNDFSAIYVFNLRGNQRTSGELSRKEGGKVFGGGSRTPIAITVLVKNPKHIGSALIRYCDIGDYLSREEKLAIIAQKQQILSQEMKWSIINPDEHGDWLNQRKSLFSDYIQIGTKEKHVTCFFAIYSGGILTSRDSWCYGYSEQKLTKNIKSMLHYYNEQRVRIHEVPGMEKNALRSQIGTEESKIKWSGLLLSNLEKNKKLTFYQESLTVTCYRPFQKQWGYFNRNLNERVYQLPRIFPAPSSRNLVICVPSAGVKHEFSCILVDRVPDYELIGKSQCFPLFYYDETQNLQKGLFDQDKEQYIRRDGITDFIHEQCRKRYSPKVKKEDVFYYVYGLLHSSCYRVMFSADLKKMLPRIPLVDKPDDFWSFSKAGRELAKLHLEYEEQPPYPDVIVSGTRHENFHVEKMRFPNKGDKSTINYNSYIRISNIPEEAYSYVVNGRSAIEWIMERYQVRVDKDSGIKNDPNDWAKENDKPRYILDLLLSIITVSVESMKIINTLPKLDLGQ